MRLKLLRWIRKNILRLSDGDELPKWAFPLACVLFPILAIRWWPKADPRYEIQNDQMVIHGIRYSMVLFDAMGKGPLGQVIKILRRENEGVTLQRLYDREWISVKERLPAYEEKIVFYKPGRSVLTGWFPRPADINNRNRGGHGGVNNIFIDYDLEMHPNITHWMPLPEPPKEGE